MKKGVLFLLGLILFSNFVFAGELKVTNEHPFLINNVWIPAKQLIVGDLLTTIDGKKARITIIEEIQENVQVYNLEDSYFHNYIANGIIVHNSDKPSGYADELFSELYSYDQNINGPLPEILPGRGLPKRDIHPNINQLYSKIRREFGIGLSESDPAKIIQDYNLLVSKLKQKSLAELKEELIGIASDAGLEPSEIITLRARLDLFETEGISIIKTFGERQFSPFKITGADIRKDMDIVVRFINKLNQEATSLGKTYSDVCLAEKDCDAFSTALSNDPNLGGLVRRTILNRDIFGGEWGEMYQAMKEVILQSKTKALESSLDQAQQARNFQIYSKQGMTDLLARFPEMKDIWFKHVSPYLSKTGDALFFDVGYRGTMQYWQAAMYEKFNPGKFADVAISYADKSGNMGLEGLVRTSKEMFIGSNTKVNEAYKNFFNRNNANMVPRLLVKSSPNAPLPCRKIVDFTSVADVEEFCLGIIRQWYAANP